MQFANLAEFVAMGGHGIYVWLAYGAGLLVIAYNVIAPWLGARSVRRVLARRTVLAAQTVSLDEAGAQVAAPRVDDLTALPARELKQ